MTNNQTQINIPNGWSQMKLGEVGSAKIGLTYSPDDVADDGMLVFRSSNVKGDKIDYRDQVKVHAEIPENLKVKEGDILICARNGSRKLIGKNAYIKKEDEGNTFGAFMLVFRSKNSKYTYHLFQSYIFKKEIARDLGPTINQVTTGHLLKYKFNFPPLPEQKRIVKVLEIWDGAIEKLTKKIEIKKSIKKGLMQRLLTGKMRLPGFTEPWQVVFLGEIGVVRTSSVDKKTVNDEKEVRLLNYMDVYRRDHIASNNKYQIVTANNQQITSSNLKKGDVLFTPSSETPDDIGHSAVVMENLEKILFSYHLIRFRPKKDALDYRYSAYCFKTYDFYLELWKKAQGATRFTLSKDAIEKSKISIPSNKEEQQAVANIFETADKEIAFLENSFTILKDQ